MKQTKFLLNLHKANIRPLSPTLGPLPLHPPVLKPNLHLQSKLLVSEKQQGHDHVHQPVVQ